MANLRGKMGMKQISLLASYKPSQVVYAKDAEGKPTKDVLGVFMNVEKDQSNFTKKGMKEGTQVPDTNPALFSETKEGENEKGEPISYTSHTRWYTKSQLDPIIEAGQMAVQKDGTIAIGFKGDVQVFAKTETEPQRVIALVPKAIKPEMDAAKVASVEKFNKQHPLQAPDHKITETTLEKQKAVTLYAREQRDAQLKEKEAQAETVVEKEAEAQMGE